MKSSIYVTFDHIREDTGAGQVCLHEIKALKSVTDLKQVICKSAPPLDVPVKILEVDKYYPEVNPFLWDYFASALINGYTLAPETFTISDKLESPIAHLSCSPGNAIASKLPLFTKVLVNMPAHDLKLSIEEHERLYGSGTYPFKHNTDPYLWDLLTKHTQTRADVIITPSTRSAKWIKETLKPKGRIEVIPHGHNPPGKVEPLHENFVAGYLGVFGPDKGLVYLIMAWSHLNLQDAYLLFAGDCGQYVKPYIDSLSGGGGIFKLAGRVQNVSDFYNDISVYVHPAVTDGFGMEVPEAMAHGRPVIVTEGTGSSDCIEHEKEGFVVPIRDPKSIADCIQYFKDNPDQIKIMGQRAREKAKKYSWEVIEKKYVELYESL